MIKPAHRDRGTTLRAITLVVLALLVSLGLSTKSYHGPGEVCVHANAGDAFYAAFWFFFVKLVWRRLALWRAAGGVFAYCCLIEFSQLLHPPCLERLRQTLPGRLILGADFDWTDIALYALGVASASALRLAIEAGVRRLEHPARK